METCLNQKNRYLCANIFETNKQSVMEKEKGTPYKTTTPEPSVVSEPATVYGLQLDAYKRYTYADYLTWMDDKRREIIDGFFHLMTVPMRRHAHVISTLSVRLFNFIEKIRVNAAHTLRPSMFACLCMARLTTRKSMMCFNRTSVWYAIYQN